MLRSKEGWIPLREERIHTLDEARSRPCRLDQQALMVQLLFEILRGLDVEEVLRRLTEMCTPTAPPSGHLEGRIEEVLLWDKVVDRPQIEGLLRIPDLILEEEAPCDLLTDQPRKEPGRAAIRGETEPSIGCRQAGTR